MMHCILSTMLSSASNAILCKDCCMTQTQSVCPMQAVPMCFTGCADGLRVLCFAGPIAVKAAVLTIVEKMHAKGIGMLYAGWPTDSAQVGSTEADMTLQRLLRAPADLPAGSRHCGHHQFLSLCAGGIHPCKYCGSGLSARLLVLLDAPLAAQPAAVQAHPCAAPHVSLLLTCMCTCGRRRSSQDASSGVAVWVASLKRFADPIDQG